MTNLGKLYQGEGKYNYSLPQPMLAGFREGTGFGMKGISETDKERLDKDTDVLYRKIIPNGGVLAEKEPWAIITAGSPGAGKTTILNEHRAIEQLKQGREIAYVDPDDVALKEMKETYKADLTEKMREVSDLPKEAQTAAKLAILKEMYAKWRNGSNYIHHLILGNLIRLKQSFFMGTTASSPETWRFFDFLRKEGYKIHLIHVIAPDEVRVNSIRERDKEFVQSNDEDIRNKGLMVPERIKDYLKYADVIDFHFRDDAKGEAHVVAKWTKDAKEPLKILDKPGYDAMKKVHNTICDQLKKEDMKWEYAVEGKKPDEIKALDLVV